MLPIQNFSSGVLAEIIRRQPPSQARTNFAWQLAVGPALARATMVRLEGGVLDVRAVDGRWLHEIERERPRILAKIQALLGRQVVTRIETGARS
jgi:predicted nucleic acid-binding Zn ribbon protein